MASNRDILLVLVLVAIGLGAGWPLLQNSDFSPWASGSILQKVICKIAAPAQPTIICTNANDTVTFVGLNGIAITTNATTKTVFWNGTANSVNFTFANVGAGAGVWKNKSGLLVNYRSIIGSGGITTAQNTNDITLALANIPKTTIAHAGQFAWNNVSKSGSSLSEIGPPTSDYDFLHFSLVDVNNLNASKVFQNGNQVIDTLLAGTGISISGIGNSRTITNTVKDTNTAQGLNLTPGTGIYSSNANATQLKFKGLTGGNCITITNNSTSININETCNGVTALKTINGNNNPNQIIQSQSGNTTVVSSSGTTTVGFGVNPVIVGGSAQEVTKKLTTDLLFFGGNVNANNFKINNLNNATSKNDAVNARNLGLIGNLTLNKCTDQQLLKYQLSNQTWVCENDLGGSTGGLNLGPSQGAVFAGKSGSNLQFKGLNGTDGFSITNGTNTISIGLTSNAAIKERIYDYLIRVNGLTIESINTHTNTIDYSGTNAATVLQNTINGLTNNGTIFIKGTLTINQQINVSKTLSLVFGKWGYYQPNIIWTGKTGYVFDFNGTNSQNNDVRNLYIDGQSNSGSGIFVGSNIGRFAYHDLGIKRMNGEGFVSDMHGGYLYGDWLEVYQCSNAGFRTLGNGQTFLDLGTINSIGNGNSTAAPNYYGIRLNNVEGNINYLIASGGSTNFGGRIQGGVLFETKVNTLKIGVLHSETISVQPIAFGLTTTASSPSTQNSMIDEITVYDDTGTESPVLIDTAKDLVLGTITTGGPNPPNFVYNAKAPFNPSFPHAVERVMIGSISTIYAGTQQLSAPSGNVTLVTGVNGIPWRTVSKSGSSLHDLSNVTSIGCGAGEVLKANNSKWICSTNSPYAGINIGTVSSNPSSPPSGEIWFLTGTNRLQVGVAGGSYTVPLISTPQTWTGSQQFNILTLGGDMDAKSFKIKNLNNATLKNDAVNARNLGLLGNMTYGSKCTDQQILKYQSSNQTWICTTNNAGSGTITGSQNIGKGTGSFGVLATPTSTTIKGKNMTAGTAITLSANTTDITISTTALTSALQTSQNVGKGTGSSGVLATPTSTIVKGKNLTASSGISISNNSTDITISSTITQGFTSLSNIGKSGFGLLKISGLNIQSKNITCGVGMACSANSTDIRINDTDSSSGFTSLSNIGKGTGSNGWLVAAGSVINSKNITAGNGIAESANTTDITITNNSPEATNSQNIGKGTSSSGILGLMSGNTIRGKNITTTAPITNSNNLTDITIACSTCLTNAIQSSQNIGKGTGSFGFLSTPSSTIVKSKNATAGAGISLSGNTTDITFTNSSPEATTSQNIGKGTVSSGVLASMSGNSIRGKNITTTSPITNTNNSTDITIACSTCITSAVTSIAGTAGNWTVSGSTGAVTGNLGSNALVTNGVNQTVLKSLSLSSGSQWSPLLLTTSTTPTSPRKGSLWLDTNGLNFNDNSNTTQTALTLAQAQTVTGTKTFNTLKLIAADITAPSTTGTPSIIFNDASNIVNSINMRGSIATGAGLIGMTGTDTNIPLMLYVKGTGTIEMFTAAKNTGLAFSYTGMTSGKVLTLSSSQTTTQTLTIPNIREAETLAVNPQTNFTQPSNQTAISSQAIVMYGGYATITPQVTGKLDISIRAQASDSTLSSGCRIDIRDSTSNMGANGATATGTVIGNNIKLNVPVTGDLIEYSDRVFVTGLTVGTKYFIDLGVASLGGGSCTLNNPSWAIREY